MVYQWKKGSRLTGDAQAVGQRLEELREQHGELRPEIVEKDARSKGSPLHDLFEWDDSAAALQYRLGQAAHIIRCIVVIDDPVVPEAHTAYVRVEVPEEAGADEEPARRSAYQRTVDVMSDAELREQVIERALHELNAWRQRYRMLDELAEIFRAIDRVNAREKALA
jgi:hypothetical protein